MMHFSGERPELSKNNGKKNSCNPIIDDFVDKGLRREPTFLKYE